jgi:hypothetical protein
LNRAAEFLLFKLWAAAHAREEIIRIIQSGVTSFGYHPESLQPGFRVGPISVETQNLAAPDHLHLWVDIYLFELGGMADALAQLVNVAFELGLSADDKSIQNNVGARLAVVMQHRIIAGPTGLESWGTARPPWLADLQELRNQATHRHLIRLAEVKPWEQAPPAPGLCKWTSDFVVDVRAGDSRPLISFIATTYDEVMNLLRATLERLREVRELYG